MIYTENYFQLWRIIADNKEEESEEMLAPGSGSACRCLCDTKEKYFIHLTRGGPRLAAACPQTRLRWGEEAPDHEANMNNWAMKELSILQPAELLRHRVKLFRLSFPIFVWRMITSQEICGAMMLFAEGQGAWDCYFDCCECEWVAH